MLFQRAIKPSDILAEQEHYIEEVVGDSLPLSDALEAFFFCALLVVTPSTAPSLPLPLLLGVGLAISLPFLEISLSPLDTSPPDKPLLVRLSGFLSPDNFL